MSEGNFINVSAGKSSDVECFECNRVVPIRESAEIKVNDKTPEKALGGGTTKMYACRSCFERMIFQTKG